MNITLPEDLDQFVRKMVASGQYRTTTELMCRALRLLQREDQNCGLAQLRKEIEVGVDQIEAGIYISGNELTVGKIRDLALRRFGSSCQP